jgi:predicted HD phosphohydrolase
MPSIFDERGVAQRFDDEAVFFEQRLHVVANRFVIVHDQDSHARYFDRQGSLLGRSQVSRGEVAVTL